MSHVMDALLDRTFSTHSLGFIITRWPCDAARGRNDVMWVNTGIRVPECAERSLDAAVSKKYYHEYECNIRSRLGTVSGKAETTFSLKESPERLAKSIIEEITDF